MFVHLAVEKFESTDLQKVACVQGLLPDVALLEVLDNNCSASHPGDASSPVEKEEYRFAQSIVTDRVSVSIPLRANDYKWTKKKNRAESNC